MVADEIVKAGDGVLLIQQAPNPIMEHVLKPLRSDWHMTPKRWKIRRR